MGSNHGGIDEFDSGTVTNEAIAPLWIAEATKEAASPWKINPPWMTESLAIDLSMDDTTGDNDSLHSLVPYDQDVDLSMDDTIGDNDSGTEAIISLVPYDQDDVLLLDSGTEGIIIRHSEFEIQRFDDFSNIINAVYPDNDTNVRAGVKSMMTRTLIHHEGVLPETDDSEFPLESTHTDTYDLLPTQDDASANNPDNEETSSQISIGSHSHYIHIGRSELSSI